MEAHGGEREADEEEGRVLSEENAEAHANRHQEMHLHVPVGEDVHASITAFPIKVKTQLDHDGHSKKFV